MGLYTAQSGRQLWFEDSGSGTPLIFIHGWCMSSAVWCFQQQEMTDSFRVITVDLPGHGMSPPVDAVFFGIRKCAEDIACLFNHLRLHNAVLAGWSLGSMIALESCLLLREQLAGVVLVSGTPRFVRGDGYLHGLSNNEVDGMTRKVERNLRRALDGFTARMFAAGERDDPAVSASIRDLLASIPLPSTETALLGLAALAGSDMRFLLGQVELPVLIIHGDSDLICPVQGAEYMAGNIPVSRLTVFDGCGHAPFLTQPVRFNACLKEFMEMVTDREY